jgi:thiol-disulfide isomerase/thioredoxin
MNKKLLWFLIAGLAISGCKSNLNEINGKLINASKDEYIFLDELKGNELITVDSVRVSGDGSFSLTRKIGFPSFYLIKTDNSNFLTLLLEPGEKINLTAYGDSLNSPISLSGSKGSELMASYNLVLRNTIRKLSSLRDIYMQYLNKPELPLVVERLDSMAHSYMDEINLYTRNFIDENINSLASLVSLYQQVAPGEYVLDPQEDLDYFIKVDSSLWLLHPDYEPVKSLHGQVGELISVAAEQNSYSYIPLGMEKAPEIALPDPEGDTIKLSSTRGSVVLIDIWAAWCGPCRRENPNLVRLYDLYHDKGFQIYQVSIDKTRQAWLKGIKEDGLEKWIHVSDLKYWSSVVVPLYKIESIPANFLLDREGNIIASGLRGETLQIKLAEIFEN